MKQPISSKDLPPLTPQKRREVLTAAYLKTQGMIYFDIGTTMFPGRKRPESKIAGLIALAKKHGFLREVINANVVSADELAPLSILAHHRRWDDTQRKLISASCGTLKTLTVCYSGPQEPTSNEERSRNAIQFATNTAPHVMPILLTCKTGLGVCWGPTLSEVASAMKQHRDAHAGRYAVSDVAIFPTVGLPPVLHGSTTAWSATQVAQTLSRALRLTSEVPSLDSFPPLLTGQYAAEPHRSYILEYFKNQHGYKAVFGSTNAKPGLIDEADGLITGAGSNELWPQFGSDSMLRADVAPNTLRELIAGDIGGVVIRAPGQDCGSAFKKLRQQWIGLTLKHIRRVNDNADRTGGPGVVLCAMGSSKAGILRELIKTHRVVRHLIIDHHLAAALGTSHTNGTSASTGPRRTATQSREPSKDTPPAMDE